MNLTSENFEENFEFEGYKKQLLKERKNFACKYEISDQSLQPNVEDLKKRI